MANAPTYQREVTLALEFSDKFTLQSLMRRLMTKPNATYISSFEQYYLFMTFCIFRLRKTSSAIKAMVYSRDGSHLAISDEEG